MDIDIRIYLKRLKDFFDSDAEARIDMFGESEIDMEEDIRKEVEIEHFVKRQQELDKIFVHTKDGFPPFCLN